MTTDYHAIGRTCHMQAARRRARELTQLYEAAFVELGLTGGQFSTLVAIGAGGGASIGLLAGKLGMDPTTMSRGLRPLERRGLIRLEPDPDDARGRLVHLTDEGGAVLERATPLWSRVQQFVEGDRT